MVHLGFFFVFAKNTLGQILSGLAEFNTPVKGFNSDFVCATIIMLK